MAADRRPRSRVGKLLASINLQRRVTVREAFCDIGGNGRVSGSGQE